MTENLPQPISDSIVPDLLALNNAHSVELSWLDVDRLKSLLRQAFYARMIGSADAFLLAFDQGASYDSPNYKWFHQRYTRFVYVDRVVVSPSLRGRGYARLLYTDLFEQARRSAHHVVVCEINSDPPNPASDAFHAAFGCQEVGQATIHEGSKAVRYLAHALIR